MPRTLDISEARRKVATADLVDAMKCIRTYADTMRDRAAFLLWTLETESASFDSALLDFKTSTAKLVSCAERIQRLRQELA